MGTGFPQRDFVTTTRCILTAYPKQILMLFWGNRSDDFYPFSIRKRYKAEMFLISFIEEYFIISRNLSSNTAVSYNIDDSVRTVFDHR